MEPENFRCDIFCRVIDNFGDAGVCWRLAKTMHVDHGWRVRLWIDRPELVARFESAPLARSGIEVRDWREANDTCWGDDPPDILIEAFGCSIPDQVLDAMDGLDGERLWIDLEYFSAEAWVADFHGHASPQTRHKLRKFVFIPGFAEASGGMLAERADTPTHERFDASAWRSRLGLPAAVPGRTTVTVFAYPHAPFHALLQSMVIAEVPAEVLLPGVSGIPAQYGSVQVRPLPFLPQDEFDALLRLSDVNFVRGEDSMTRALLVGHPMVWNIYRQEGNAHHPKLDAWLSHLTTGAGEQFTVLCDRVHRAWNGVGNPIAATEIAKFTAHAARFFAVAAELRERSSLGERLALFCREKIKC